MSNSRLISNRLIEDKRLIEHEDDWPMWPILPFRHRTEREASGMPKTGIMVSGCGPVIFVGCVFDPKFLENIEHAPRKQYPDNITLLNDGWEVD